MSEVVDIEKIVKGLERKLGEREAFEKTLEADLNDHKKQTALIRSERDRLSGKVTDGQGAG